MPSGRQDKRLNELNMPGVEVNRQPHVRGDKGDNAEHGSPSGRRMAEAQRTGCQKYLAGNLACCVGQEAVLEAVEEEGGGKGHWAVPSASAEGKCEGWCSAHGDWLTHVNRYTLEGSLLIFVAASSAAAHQVLVATCNPRWHCG